MITLKLDYAPSPETLAMERAAYRSRVVERKSFIPIGGYAPVWTERKYTTLADEGYRKNPDVYACVQQIVTSAKGVPWYVYDQTEYGDVDKSDDKAWNQLLKRPNAYQSWPELIEATLGYWLLSGNFYIEGIWATSGSEPGKRGAGLPREIHTHRPDRIEIIPEGSGGRTESEIIRDSSERWNPVAAYRYKVNGKEIRFNDPSVICHGKLFNPLNEYYGISPIEAAAYGVDIANEARCYMKAQLKNGVRPSGALVAPADVTLTQEQVDDMKGQINSDHKGAGNAGKWFLFYGGLDWKEMSMSPVDAQLLETRRYEKRDIASIFGVPAQLIGDETAKTFANYEQARRALYEDTVLPLLTAFRDRLNMWLQVA